jgi:hypothetical protein
VKDKSILIHLGKGELGVRRIKALLSLASDEAYYWNSKPSIGRYIVYLADKKIRDDENTKNGSIKKLDKLFISIKERIARGDEPNDIYLDCKGGLESILGVVVE